MDASVVWKKTPVTGGWKEQKCSGKGCAAPSAALRHGAAGALEQPQAAGLCSLPLSFPRYLTREAAAGFWPRAGEQDPSLSLALAAIRRCLCPLPFSALEL